MFHGKEVTSRASSLLSDGSTKVQLSRMDSSHQGMLKK
jgi:hypothetical protein